MNVYVVLRNEQENGRRCFLGVWASRDKAVEAVAANVKDYCGVYEEADYDILESELND